MTELSKEEAAEQARREKEAQQIFDDHGLLHNMRTFERDILKHLGFLAFERAIKDK